MKLFKSKSVLRVWTLAYALMLIIVICTNIYIIDSTNTRLLGELEKTNKYFMKNVGVSLDGYFSEINTMRNEISASEEVNSVCLHTEQDGQLRLAAAGAVDAIEKISIRHTDIYDVIIYYPALDLVATSKSFAQSRTYYDLTLGGEDYDEWLAGLNAFGNNYSMDLIRDESSDESDMFCMTVPIYDAALNVKYTARFYIKKKMLFETVGEGDALAILNERGTLLVSSDRKEYDFSNAHFTQEGAYKLKAARQNGEEVYVTYFNSSKYRYKYVYITHHNNYARTSTMTLIVGIISNILCVLCMFAVMFGVSRWNYGKIRNLLEGTDEDFDTDVDEYEQIKRRINKSLEENSFLERKLETQFSIVRSSFLADYLNGSSTYKDVENYLELYKINPSGKYFFAAAVRIVKYGVMEEAAPKDAAFVVNNILQDIAGENGYIYAEVDGAPVYIVDCEAEDDEKKTEWADILKKTNKLAQQFLNLHFTAGLSSIAAGFEASPELYRQAVKAVEYAVFYNTAQIVDYSSIADVHMARPTDLKRVSSRYENELMLYVKNGERENACRVIDEIFSENDGRGKWYYIGLMYNILNIVSDYARKQSQRCYEHIISRSADFDDNSSLADISRMMRDIVCEVCALSQNEDAGVYGKVKQYVDENFTDVALNVSAIGERFSMSSIYISKVFKDCSGMKLGTYISERRIEYAKKLLTENKKIKIDEVAQLAGYDLTRTFLKQFKEKEGITPTQWRKMNG